MPSPFQSPHATALGNVTALALETLNPASAAARLPHSVTVPPQSLSMPSLQTSTTPGETVASVSSQSSAVALYPASPAQAVTPTEPSSP